MDVRFQDGHGLKYKDRRHMGLGLGLKMQKNRRTPPSAADGSGEVALARVLRRLRDDGARRFFCISNPNPRLV